MKVFVQDPDTYVNALQLEVPCRIHTDRPATIDPLHRSQLNFEVFYFADAATKRRFDADPLRWCGPVTDPVTLQRFLPEARSPFAVYEGRTYYFASEEDRAAFVAHAESLSVPRFRMSPMMMKQPSM